MKTIFVMVKCDLGRAYEVADSAVGNVEQVSEVYSTSGQFDLLMKCYLPDAVDIGHRGAAELLNDTRHCPLTRANVPPAAAISAARSRGAARTIAAYACCRRGAASAYSVAAAVATT